MIKLSDQRKAEKRRKTLKLIRMGFNAASKDPSAEDYAVRDFRVYQQQQAHQYRVDDPVKGYQYATDFLDVEAAATTESLFWKLAGLAWRAGGSFDPKGRWLKAFERKRSRPITLIERYRLFNAPYTISPALPEAEYAAYWGNKVLQKGGTITAYRAFHVSKGQPIRGTNEKPNEKQIREAGRDNENTYYRQEGGFGFSYSLSRIAATAFPVVSIKDKILEKYSGVDPGTPEFNEMKKKVLAAHYYGNKADEAAYVGKYEICTDDIIAPCFVRFEEEIVATKAKLIHYAPLGLADNLTAFFWTAQTEHFWKKSKYLNLYHLSPEQKLMTAGRKVVREWMKSDDNLHRFFTSGVAFPEFFALINPEMPKISEYEFPDIPRVMQIDIQ